MRVLYGVVGEGMGHAIRSRVVLTHLFQQGHEVHVMASGRATDFLKKHFPDVHRIHGLHMIYEDNRVRRGKTFWSNVLAGLTGVPKNIAAYFKLLDEFSPEVAISDFESWSYLFAKTHRLPIVSIDNMQIIDRCTHDPDIIGHRTTDFQIAKTFVKGKLPRCDEYFITTFFRPPVRKAHTHLFPPILRPEILAARPTAGSHLLAYQTAEGEHGFVRALEEVGVEARVYGANRSLEQDEARGKVTLRPFSESRFVDDLASCRGVIAGGGFTLMGEALHLRKPMLVVPLSRQFEQIMNGRYLAKSGFGMTADSVTTETVSAFVAELDRYAQALESYEPSDNSALLDALDEFLDRAAAGVA